MKKNQLESNQFKQSSPELHPSDFKPYRSAGFVRGLAGLFITASIIGGIILLLNLFGVIHTPKETLPMVIYVSVGCLTIAAFMMIIGNMSFDIQFLAYNLERMEEENNRYHAFVLNHLQQIEATIQNTEPQQSEEKREHRYLDL